LEINGTAMTTNANVVALIDSAIRTYVREWLMPSGENDNTFISPTDNSLRIVIRNTNDNEVVFEIEE
jgi:hypothetical protein